MSKKNETPAVKTIRCAIYTRKSTEEGLQQEFNSLDAQRESSEAFIKSQKAEGWRCLPEMYDDGGFSGGNLERPAMKRLMDGRTAGGESRFRSGRWLDGNFISSDGDCFAS